MPNGKGKGFSAPAVAKRVIGLHCEELRHYQVNFESDHVLRQEKYLSKGHCEQIESRVALTQVTSVLRFIFVSMQVISF